MRQYWSKIEDEEGEVYNASHLLLEVLGSIVAIIVTFVFIMPGWVWNAALEPVLKGVRLIQADIYEGRNQASLESENGS